MKDGEFIYDYMKNIMNIEKIGIHGESIGGIVCNYIAKNRNVDLLISDRTFSSLANVAYYSFHPILYVLFTFFTLNRWS